jgi:hypothetical protein
MGQKHSRSAKPTEQTIRVDKTDDAIIGEKVDPPTDVIYNLKFVVPSEDDEVKFENRKQLAAQLRADSVFLELVAWALERKYKVTIDDLCWLHYSHIEPGFAATGILSIDELSSYSAFKAAFLQKDPELRKTILEAQQTQNGGIITPMIKTEIEKGLSSQSLDTLNL